MRRYCPCLALRFEAKKRAVLAMKPKSGFTLTKDALDRFLAGLDENRERAGKKYETLRLGLIRFFEWRGCAASIDHADETIDRLVRKLDQGVTIRDIPSFATG